MPFFANLATFLRKLLSTYAHVPSESFCRITHYFQNTTIDRILRATKYFESTAKIQFAEIPSISTIQQHMCPCHPLLYLSHINFTFFPLYNEHGKIYFVMSPNKLMHIKDNTKVYNCYFHSFQSFSRLEVLHDLERKNFYKHQSEKIWFFSKICKIRLERYIPQKFSRKKLYLTFKILIKCIMFNAL